MSKDINLLSVDESLSSNGYFIQKRLEIWFIRINGFIISEVLPKIKEGLFHNLAPKKEKKEKKKGDMGEGVAGIIIWYIYWIHKINFEGGKGKKKQLAYISTQYWYHVNSKLSSFFLFLFLRKFQSIASTSDNIFLSLDQDINRFLV